MKQIAVISHIGHPYGDDDYSHTAYIPHHITEWEEVSEEDYNLIINNWHRINQSKAAQATGQIMTLITKQNTRAIVIPELAKIKEEARKQEALRQKQEEERKHKLMEKKLRKAIKMKESREKSIIDLVNKYGISREAAEKLYNDLK